MKVLRKRDYLNNLFPEVLDLGDNFSLRKSKPIKIVQFLTKFFKKDRNKVSYDVYYKEVEVGFLVFWENQKDPDEAYINWISVKNKFEGHKIAQRVLRKVLEFLKNLDYKKVTLEVPGNSPNARHIYEKFGFTDIEDRRKDLTPMELDLTKFKS